MQVIFWQNIPSIHQAPFIRALAELCQETYGGALTVICEEDMPERRKKMGWVLPDFGQAKLIIKPDQHERDRLLEQNKGKDCHHIFSGFDMTPLNNRTLKAAMKLPCKTGVYLERPQGYPFFKAKVRKLKYYFYARKYGSVDYIFSIGQMAFDYYRNCGFESKKIYPFAYFVDKPETHAHQEKDPNTLKFLYVGQNIYRKGIDILISALENLSENKWGFDFIGVPEAGYEQYNVPNAIKGRIKFHGAKSNVETMQVMSASDVLVLPSRFDGWGAVVNEALLNGMKVIVSSEVGAKDFVENAQWRGYIFQTRSVKDLQQKMSEIIQEGSLATEDRQKISEWAFGTISPQRGAEYFIECLRHGARNYSQSKPQVPWL